MQPELYDEIKLMRQAIQSIEFAADDNVGELRHEANVAPYHTWRAVSRRADNLHLPRQTECVESLRK